MPMVSVITIGKDLEQISDIRSILENQSIDDWEFCYSTRSGIPEAWNHAITKSTGDLLVFTETDVEIIFDDWLERIVDYMSGIDNKIVMFGDTGRGVAFNWANTAIPREVLQDTSLDESFPICEDSELFARLDKKGVEFEYNPIAPVYHNPCPRSSGGAWTQFRRGWMQARILLNHGRIGPSTQTNHPVVNNSITENEVVFSRLQSIAKSTICDLLYYAGFGLKYSFK